MPTTGFTAGLPPSPPSKGPPPGGRGRGGRVGGGGGGPRGGGGRGTAEGRAPPAGPPYPAPGGRGGAAHASVRFVEAAAAPVAGRVANGEAPAVGGGEPVAP